MPSSAILPDGIVLTVEPANLLSYAEIELTAEYAAMGYAHAYTPVMPTCRHRLTLLSAKKCRTGKFLGWRCQCGDSDYGDQIVTPSLCSACTVGDKA